VILSYTNLIHLLPVLTGLVQPKLQLFLFDSILLTTLWFTRDFLELANKPSILSKINSILIILVILLTVILVVTPVGLGFQLGSVLSMIIILVNLVTGFIRFRHGQKEAKIYLCAFSIVAVVLTIVIVGNLGFPDLLPNLDLLLYMAYFAESIVLSFAVGVMYRRQVEAVKYARNEAQTDPLTKVLNRRAYISHEWIDSLWPDGHVAGLLVMVDIDNLKEVNDTEGHSRGDELITLVARKLMRLSYNSRLFRLGGDEFILILDTCHEAYSHEELILKLESLGQQIKEEGFVCSGISYGLAEVDSVAHMKSAAAVADKEMYKMKQSKPRPTRASDRNKLRHFRSEDGLL